MSASTAAHPAAVFIEGNIARPMGPVLDRPIIAAQTEQTLWSGVLGFEAADTIKRLSTELLTDDVCGIAVDRKETNATCLMWKTMTLAEMSFGNFHAPHLVANGVEGRKYIDGIEIQKGQGRRLTLYTY